ncbi:hypothetical protein [Yinghuangia seranimata]|uniref:hypothetical protein n=1 Tax=Yinghuangia seranimata TaxID=408067 RepID=UPI00248C4D84|nr:hypothetical protein [Yinghuangia seranimata]MDI2130550.1 hypothetical protein [Yinghuangia seranimata]
MTYTEDTSTWTEPDLAADTDTTSAVHAPVRSLQTPEEAGALVRRSSSWMRRKAALEIPLHGSGPHHPVF